MNDHDILQRFMFENAPVRGEIIHLNESYRAVMQKHLYPPLIQKLLGETLVAAALMAAIIKFQGRLTVQFRGSGKLSLLLAQCDEQFHLRGLAQWQGNITEDELLEALRQGTLAIMIEPAIPGGRRYQGIVAWKGHTLAESLEAYFYQSEQLATRIWLASDESSAAGLLLQVMPKEKPELYQEDWERIQILTNTVKPKELLQLDNHTLLRRLYSEEEVRVFTKIQIQFQCTCSIEKSENAILILGLKEAEAELKSKENIVVTCEFCQKTYVFDRIDIARIFKKGDKPPSGTSIH